MAEICLVGIGEVLMDVFEDGTETVGGAPVNVAFHAHQLLQASGKGFGAVVSAVGDDARGHHILDWLDEAGLSKERVSVDPAHSTGIAKVFVRDGEAGFDIADDAAWDHLKADGAIEELARLASAVAFGSLAQRAPGSGSTIRRFVELVDGHRLYDVNLRVNATNGARGFSPEILRESCKVATILKANSGEIEDVMQMLGLPSVDAAGDDKLRKQMEQVLEAFGLFAVVVTRGALGAVLLGPEGRIVLPDSTLPVDEVHPVGAGDAFSAGLLYGLCLGCTLHESARIADRLASWVTQFRSATPTITQAMVRELQDLEQTS